MTDELFHTLPQHLKTACATNLERYQRFLENDPGDDPKRVTSHHQAAKTAVSHMTALIKLLKLFDKLQPEKKTENDLDSLLRQARHVLGADHDAENQL